MSELGAEVRQRTDALDALGNTTAATGKGFAIGSAALTALALLASYIEEIKIAMARVGTQMTNVAGETIDATKATIPDFMNFFQVNLMNPKVLVGAFIGAMAAFLFCGLTMGAVGRAAGKMVEEVRRQFREIKGILEGNRHTRLRTMRRNQYSECSTRDDYPIAFWLSSSLLSSVFYSEWQVYWAC